MSKGRYHFKTEQLRDEFIKQAMSDYIRLHLGRKFNENILYGLIKSEASGEMPPRILNELSRSEKMRMIDELVVKGTFMGYCMVADLMEWPDEDAFYYKKWKAERKGKETPLQMLVVSALQKAEA